MACESMIKELVTSNEKTTNPVEGRNQLIFAGAEQNDCNLLYLTAKHSFENFVEAIARLSLLVTSLNQNLTSFFQDSSD